MAFDANSFPVNALDSLYPGNLSDPFAPGGAFGIPTAASFDLAEYGIPTDGNFNLGSFGIPSEGGFNLGNFGIPSEGGFNLGSFGIPTDGIIPNFGANAGGGSFPIF
ncbi:MULTISPECIES: hypothetical protein [unclassified Nostoc]|uniref:hypothetical protein n=1 Tax=unclassified Nostoc TaxID=2593658 RepID=UPI0013D2E37B|nr:MULTISPECIES: hypothetical protein [unclassified Nostoc]MBE8996836.1 hypothetical protein [Nostoc sp. LEGE 12447]NEU79607.1 hypothetical protein [Nostoc sp. UIC 10630]